MTIPVSVYRREFVAVYWFWVGGSDSCVVASSRIVTQRVVHNEHYLEPL